MRYHTSLISKATGVSADTIRVWKCRGIVSISNGPRIGSVNTFSEDDAVLLAVVRTFTDVGLEQLYMKSLADELAYGISRAGDSLHTLHFLVYKTWCEVRFNDQGVTPERKPLAVVSFDVAGIRADVRDRLKNAEKHN